jgi:hypothetical protein
VRDPSQAASKSTQRLALAGMFGLYIIYIVIAGTGGLLVFPVGAFLLLAAGYLVWEWWKDREQEPAA